MLTQLHQWIGLCLSVTIGSTIALSGVYCAMTAAALALRRFRPTRAPLPCDALLPSVTVQIPTYNELAALNCAQCCLDFDYPHEKLQILIGDDSSQAPVSREIDEFARQHPVVRVCRRGGNQGFKPGNLNHMLRETKGDYILILDSDFLPARDFLRRLTAPAAADPSLAGVQAAWRVANARQSLSALMGTGIINVIHVVILPLLKRWAGTSLFCGSAELVRRDLLVRQGGWTPGALTEDVDYSLRLLAGGERILFLEDLTCQCEAPHTPRDLFRQQMRWAYGVMRAIMNHGRRLMASAFAPRRAKAAVACFCGGYIMVALMFAAFMLGLLNFATAWPWAGELVAREAWNLAQNILLTCGMMVSAMCAGLATGFGARTMVKLAAASFTIGLGLLFFVCKGLLKAALGLPMHWFMLKKNGNGARLAAAPNA